MFVGCEEVQGKCSYLTDHTRWYHSYSTGDWMQEIQFSGMPNSGNSPCADIHPHSLCKGQQKRQIVKSRYNCLSWSGLTVQAQGCRVWTAWRDEVLFLDGSAGLVSQWFWMVEAWREDGTLRSYAVEMASNNLGQATQCHSSDYQGHSSPSYA